MITLNPHSYSTRRCWADRLDDSTDCALFGDRHGFCLQAPNAEAARAEGVKIAREMLHRVRGLVQGAQVTAPLGRYSSAIDVLDGMATAAV